MRRCFALILMAAMLLSLAGCGGENENETKPTVITVEPTETTVPRTTQPSSSAEENTLVKADFPLEDQIALMVEAKDLWLNEDEMYSTLYNYTVTDLDQNGRYELLFGSCVGSGLFTYVNMWEVNEDGTGLSPVEASYAEGESQADIIRDQAKVYYNREDNLYYYIFSDEIRNGWMWQSSEQRALWLSFGKVNEKTLGRYVCETDESFVTREGYYDAEGNEISKMAYEDLAPLLFELHEELDATIHWQSIDIEEVGAMTDDVLQTLLQQSAQSFRVE